MQTKPNEMLAVDHTSVRGNSDPQTLVTDGRTAIGAYFDGRVHVP